MPLSFIIPAVASIGGALIGSNASQSAANTQAQAADQASQVQQNMFNTTQGNLKPYMGAGTNALSALQQMLGLGGGAGGAGAPDYSAFMNSPGYQFQLQQGLGAIQGNAAATGGATGNTLRSLMGYGQGLAGQTFNQYLGQLQGLAGAGQNAAANLGGFSGQAAGQIGGALQSAGNATAAGQMGSANALVGGINGAAQNYMLQQMLSGGGGIGGYTSAGTQQLGTGGYGYNGPTNMGAPTTYNF